MGSHGISEDWVGELYRLRFDVRSYHDTGCFDVGRDQCLPCTRRGF